MRTIKEILRLLLFCGLSYRQIQKSKQISRTTIGEYAKRAAELGLSWQEIASLTETELEGMLFPLPAAEGSFNRRPLPDWQKVDEELRRYRNLTLMQVWEEYRENNPNGYGYSRFHYYFQEWKKKQDVVMRQMHRAGEKVFIDYCDGPIILDSFGRSIKTQIFVAVWGASNYTFATATTAQDLPSWISAHVAALEFFGCVPQIAVPDNLKAGVSRACRYDPDINPTYADLACHYGFAVIPTRPRKPRDKAKVEAGVLLVQRWILAALRKQTFASIAEFNAAISGLLEKLNNKLMKKTHKSRKQLFEELDRPAAQPLPSSPYEYAVWKKATVGPDYHVSAQGHHYSVPCQLIGEKVDLRLTTNTVEVFYKGSRITSHPRSQQQGGMTTCDQHRPERHRQYLAADLATIRLWSERIGPATAQLLDYIWERYHRSPSALRAFQGIYSLARKFGTKRVEAAAGRAIRFGGHSYTSLKRILSLGLDLQTDNKKGSPQKLPHHDNIRGSQYY